MTEGLIIAGRYHLLSKLGQGGMGSVYRGVHLELGTPVAVKLVNPGTQLSTTALSRFRREARAAASIRSTHVVQILDYGVDGVTPYIVMELLEGESLAQLLEREGVLVPSFVSKVLSQVGKALERAHSMNIVHRDLKPGNIFLSLEGAETVAKVLDFGIAKRLNESPIDGTIETQSGAIIGTAHYMSPEQATGRGTVDQRTDIWALGVIAFECITGIRPFRGATLGGLTVAICSDPRPLPSEYASVPPGFDAWFERATDRNVEGRYSTMAEAISCLQRICDGHTAVRCRAEVGATDSRVPLSRRTIIEAPVSSTAVASSRTIATARKKQVRFAWLVAGLPVLGFAAVALLFGNRYFGARHPTEGAGSHTAPTSAAPAVATQVFSDSALSRTSEPLRGAFDSKTGPVISSAQPVQSSTDVMSRSSTESRNSATQRSVPRRADPKPVTKSLVTATRNATTRAETAPAARAPEVREITEQTPQSPEDRLAF